MTNSGPGHGADGFDPPAPGYPGGAGLPPPLYPGPPLPGAYPGHPAPGYYYSPYPARPQGTNGKAIAALVTSLAGFVCCVPALVGLLLGIIAMRETKSSGQDGYGLALAGVVVGGFIMAGYLLYLGLMLLLWGSSWQWAP